MLEDHIPQGDPCVLCGRPALRHRIEHQPDGDPCSKCGLPASRHRVRYREQHSKLHTTFLGIDGEGQGRKDHKYVLLAAAEETMDGANHRINPRVWYVEDTNGLSTERCLDFILNLPQHNTKTFAYAFNYDMTKILVDLPDDKLYLLFRPELRQRFGPEALKGPRPVRWNGYSLNLQGTKFTIKRGPRYRVIWDIWKFYQGKFVTALRDWKVGTPELWHEMELMKDQRHEFDKKTMAEVRPYCFSECRAMADLARALVNAHQAAGLKLRSFYGAGSTAGAMLGKMGIKDKIRPAPKDMQRAVASAFFGGRFENSVIGEIHGTIYNYDISSAYPYHLCFLPCLIHGKWRQASQRSDIESPSVTAALIRYSLQPPSFHHAAVGDTTANHRISHPLFDSWAPFPFRTSDGSICFPRSSGGGWVWKDEFLAGERLFPNTRYEEAWIYESKCDCQPFDQIPGYYLERLKIGKEGPGIVIKLGMNSNYGKLAQSVGKGMFNSWIWAGLITSNTRAQILSLIALHQDPRNLLMVATDGIQTRERLITPKPKDTGTDIDVIETKSGKVQRKPLGGWEEDIITQGVFYARPGIYFPLNPTKDQLKKVRGRGVGKGVILENHRLIIDSWNQYGIHRPATVANVSRFCGAKSSVSRSGSAERPTFRRAAGDGGGPAYGQWVTREVAMSFNPMPKRAGVSADGVSLVLRDMALTVMSTPYSKAMRSDERVELEAAGLELSEQPDADLTDYELDPVTNVME